MLFGLLLLEVDSIERLAILLDREAFLLLVLLESWSSPVGRFPAAPFHRQPCFKSRASHAKKQESHQTLYHSNSLMAVPVLEA